MKLTSLTIEDFRQFKDFRLDFTDPATGRPLEKVCFIGPNGTGKSTLLKALAGHAWGIILMPSRVKEIVDASKADWTGADGEQNEFGGNMGRSELSVKHLLSEKLLTVNCPAEGDWDYHQSDEHGNSTTWFELPATNLNEALAQHSYPVQKHVINISEATKFWNELIYHLHERRRRLEEFQRLPQNRELTIAQIDSLFDPKNPEVLPRLAGVWNRILHLANLEFDLASASVPFHLTDNLEVFIRTRSSHTRIPYGALSTGIIHYLFRLGHIWSLYFNRPPGDSILLVDEPEGSLYPDFLYDIVENYREVAPGCQLFMATHSPIVASQFKPEERFILTFGDDGCVTARRGVSPEGDDPNDLLSKDFGVRNLMPAAGQEKWEEFLELRRRILLAPPEQRLPLVEKSARIGQDYNFPLNGA